MSKGNNFIFFGCWNNINCKKDFIYRDIVLNSIKTFENEIEDMFIAGDNWYSTLINKTIKQSQDPKEELDAIQEVKDTQAAATDLLEDKKLKNPKIQDSNII